MEIEKSQGIVAEKFGLVTFNGACETTSDLTKYENLAPVLDELRTKEIGWTTDTTDEGLFVSLYETKPCINSREESVGIGRVFGERQYNLNSDLPTTLLTMIAEMISKGEV